MKEKGQVIVTGGSRGIGASIMVELDRRGYSCTALSRSGDAPCGTGMVCDITDENAIREAFSQIAARGPISALINNAGLHTDYVSEHLPTAEFEQAIRINATGALIGCREIYPYLKESKGVIINMGSFYDKLGIPRNVGYCAAKAAVGAITRCLAVEWAMDGIAVVNIAPGYIETDLNREALAKDSFRAWLSRRVPGREAGKPEQVARFIGALLEADVPFLTGDTIYIDGAHSINN